MTLTFDFEGQGHTLFPSLNTWGAHVKARMILSWYTEPQTPKNKSKKSKLLNFTKSIKRDNYDIYLVYYHMLSLVHTESLDSPE